MTIEWIMRSILQSAEARNNRVDTTPEDAWEDEVEEAAIDGMLYLLDKWLEQSGKDHVIYDLIGNDYGPEVLNYITVAKRNHRERVARTTKLTD